MEVQVQQLTPVLVEFSVTVEQVRVKKEVDKAFVEPNGELSVIKKKA